MTSRGPADLQVGCSAALPNTVTDEHKRRLDEDGYVVLEGMMGPALLARLRARILELFDEEGEQAGREFRTEAHAHRLANLVDKGEVFRRAIALPGVLDGVQHVLGPAMKLSSLNARSADPHSDAGQPLHVDMAAIPDERGYWVCNTIWMLDDFTPDNGATRVDPGLAHLGHAAAGRAGRSRSRRIRTRSCSPGRAGGVVVMNAHLWHGGTANRTERAAAGDARLLLPARQAAAAVSEAAAAPGGAGRADARDCAICWRSTIR